MERKSGISAEVVTAGEIRARLPHTQTLSVEEERTVRMRTGLSVDPAAPLPRAAGSNAELQDELLLMEMQLLRTHRARAGVTTLAARPQVMASPTKSKIVRALRKKR